MTTPFIGEIRMFAGYFAPVDWNFCDGTIVQISANPTLYQLLGTTYGGDGVNTFALPDLRGRVPLHVGTGSGAGTGSTYTLGEADGFENITLQTANLPAHSHALNAATAAAVKAPSSTVIPAGNASSPAAGQVGVYGPFPGPQGENLHPGTILPDGQGLPHDNIQPYLAVSFIIALVGIFPPHP
jgi:microcystin-dependent protein